MRNSRHSGEKFVKSNGKRVEEEQPEQTQHGNASSFAGRPQSSSVQPNLDPMNESMDEYKLYVKKVELPGFDGFDPVGWISRAETYFEVHNTDDLMKIK